MLEDQISNFCPGSAWSQSLAPARACETEAEEPRFQVTVAPARVRFAAARPARRGFSGLGLT